MIKKTLAIALMAAAFSVNAQELTASVAAVSNYSFRGVSQTHGNAAVQAGVDYSSVAGPYVGVFASNVSWVKDFSGAGGVEADAYAGYRGTISAIGYDAGVVRYSYPGHGQMTVNPITTEAYGQLTYGIVSVKYSQTTSQGFVGWNDSHGSNYIEANANYDLGSTWTLIGHTGHQVVKGPDMASYSDCKVGITKGFENETLGLAVSRTNSHTAAYDWARFDGSGKKNVAGTQIIASFTKGF